MIPPELVSPPAVELLMEYLRTEIRKARQERQQLEQTWVNFQRLYRAHPRENRKEFPFVGASNLVIPMIATDVDIIYSRLMGVLFSTENLWSIQPLKQEMIDYAPRVEEFLKWAQRKELGVYDAVADFMLEMVKLGTGVLKQRYRRETTKMYEFREGPMGAARHTVLQSHNSPVLQHVSLYDFLVPSYSNSIDEAPWVAERINLTWQQLQNRMKAGIYTNTDRLQYWHAIDRGSAGEEEMMRLDRYVPTISNKFEFWETWLNYDIHGDGEPVALVVTFHEPSGTLMRIDYNPFFNQEKPYSSARFMRQEKRFYGIGVGEMLQQMQEAVTTMHNQRLDNATLANTTMYKARNGAGIRQDEPVFPGRWFLLDEMDDVQVMRVGERYDSTLPYEHQIQSYATNRTGVNDVIMGRPTPAIGYGTAFGNQMIHQEAAKRFDQTLREIRQALGDSGTRILELYQQFDQGGKVFEAMGEKDGQLVTEVLQFPLGLIRTGVGVEVTATNADLNKDVEIRTNTIIMQMITQFYSQMLEGMQLLLNPQVPVEMRAMVMQMMNGGNIMARRVLDSYGMQDVDQLIPELKELLNGGAQDTSAQAIPGGNVQPQGALPAPGMGSVQPGGGGNGVPVAGFPGA